MPAREPTRDDIFHPSGQVDPECLSEAAAKVLHEALRMARDTRWDSVRSPHIFMGLLAVPDTGVRAWGERLGADLDKLLQGLSSGLNVFVGKNRCAELLDKLRVEFLKP